MTTTQETTKAKREREIFLRFRELVPDGELWGQPISMAPPHPDLLCEHATYGPVAIELGELCSKEAAAMIEHSLRTGTSQARGIGNPVWEVTAGKLRKSKTYVSRHPIELLLYTDGRVVTPDELLRGQVLACVDSADHVFRRVWFMGERAACCIWEDR